MSVNFIPSVLQSTDFEASHRFKVSIEGVAFPVYIENITNPQGDVVLSDTDMEGFFSVDLVTPAIDMTCLSDEEFDAEAFFIAWSRNNYEASTGASNVLNNSRKVRVERLSFNNQPKSIQNSSARNVQLADNKNVPYWSLAFREFFAVPEKSPQYDGENEAGIRKFSVVLKKVGYKSVIPREGIG